MSIGALGLRFDLEPDFTGVLTLRWIQTSILIFD